SVQSSWKHPPAEILGMEGILLEKLQWDLHTATPMDFLNIVSTMFCIPWPLVPGVPQRNPSLHGPLFTRQLQHWMASHQLVQFKGSTLVLVIITLELDRLTAACCPVPTALLEKAQGGS
ncbi:CCNI2 protein, partial [Serilophus lunatus]|nr:CCNI2 protein [Serilophus lunatus]